MITDRDERGSPTTWIEDVAVTDLRRFDACTVERVRSAINNSQTPPPRRHGQLTAADLEMIVVANAHNSLCPVDDDGGLLNDTVGPDDDGTTVGDDGAPRMKDGACERGWNGVSSSGTISYSREMYLIRW